MLGRFSLAVTLYALAWLGHAAPPPIRVLVVDGYSNHDWKLTTRVIQAVLAKDGRFDVTVSTVPTSDTAALAAWKPDFAAYDVVMQTCNDRSGKGPRWPRAAEQALETYVSGGGGLYVYHSGNNAFQDWAEYNKIIGMGWRSLTFGVALLIEKDGTVTRVPPGNGGNTGHGPRVDALLTCLGDHPIHAGLPPRFMAADIEVYTYARGPAENVTVIACAEDAKEHLNHPIEWVIQYGRGRVYNSTLGHVWPGDKIQPSARCVAFQTLMVRALQWLAGREVDQTAPADFPTAESIRVRRSPIPGEEGGPTRYTSTKGHEVPSSD